MQAYFPGEFGFWPRTWAMPTDLLDFRSHWFHNNKSAMKGEPAPGECLKRPVTYIVKPEDMSNGRGVFISRELDSILKIALNERENPLLTEEERRLVKHKKNNYVVQEYLERPHKIDDFKYDLRLYVVLHGVAPLRIYLHKYSFARCTSEVYEPPEPHNLRNRS